jgi:hypothetical protein
MQTVFMTHKATPDYVGPLTATVDPSQIDEWKIAGWEIGTDCNTGDTVGVTMSPAITEIKRNRGRPSKS